MTGTARTFPTGGRRLVVLTVFSPRGEADPVLLRALGGLRPHAAELHVVVNGEMDAQGLESIGDLADHVTVRENTGFDIAAQRDALLALDEVADGFDEILLTNDTWYGPMTDFAALFARMDAVPNDFWGLTEHPAVDWIPRHVQSFWFAARRSVTASELWRTYWRDQPTAAAYWDAVLGHELVLTGLLEAAGFVSAVAFPSSDTVAGNATIVAPVALIEAGCPVLKKRVFFFDPPELARRGGDAAAAASAAVSAGYPAELLWRHLVRHVAPATLAASCTLLEAGRAAAPRPGASVLALAWGPDADGVTADPFGAAASGWDVILAGVIAGMPTRARSVRRIAGSTGVRELVEACAAAGHDQYDAVVMVPAAGPQPDALSGRTARSIVLDRGVARLLAEPGLGLVIPAPAPGARRESSGDEDAALARTVRAAAGIRVPADAGPPLAPVDGAWVARPAVLARLAPAIAALAGTEASAVDRVLGEALAAAAGEEGLRTLSLTTQESAMRALALSFVRDVETEEPVAQAAGPGDEPRPRRALLRRWREGSRR